MLARLEVAGIPTMRRGTRTSRKSARCHSGAIPRAPSTNGRRHGHVSRRWRTPRRRCRSMCRRRARRRRRPTRAARRRLHGVTRGCICIDLCATRRRAAFSACRPGCVPTCIGHDFRPRTLQRVGDAIRFPGAGFVPGGLAYDCVSHRLLVADRQARKIIVSMRARPRDRPRSGRIGRLPESQGDRD